MAFEAIGKARVTVSPRLSGAGGSPGPSQFAISLRRVSQLSLPAGYVCVIVLSWVVASSFSAVRNDGKSAGSPTGSTRYMIAATSMDAHAPSRVARRHFNPHQK